MGGNKFGRKEFNGREGGRDVLLKARENSEGGRELLLEEVEGRSREAMLEEGGNYCGKKDS